MWILFDKDKSLKLGTEASQSDTESEVMCSEETKRNRSNSNSGISLPLSMLVDETCVKKESQPYF